MASERASPQPVTRKVIQRPVRWEWFGLAALPLGVLVTDRHLPAPWVIGLSALAALMILLALKVPHRIWGGTTKALVDHIQRDLDERESSQAKELLGASADSLDQLIATHSPRQSIRFRSHSKRQRQRQILLSNFEPQRTEALHAIDEAIAAGAQDRGAKLLAENPRGSGDLISLLAALRRMMLELS